MFRMGIVLQLGGGGGGYLVTTMYYLGEKQRSTRKLKDRNISHLVKPLEQKENNDRHYHTYVIYICNVRSNLH
jgi:hypothetical protein